jgi:hypothetical protein
MARIYSAHLYCGVVFALFACTITPNVKPPPVTANVSTAPQADFSGALLVIRLVDAGVAPSTVSINVAQAAGADVAVSAKLSKRSGNEYAEYLLAFALPAKQYTLKSLWRGSIPGKASQLITELNIPVTITPRNPAYLGRLIIDAGGLAQNTRPDLFIESHFEADTAEFNTALPALNSVTIENSPIPNAELIASQMQRPLKLQLSTGLTPPRVAPTPDFKESPVLEVSATGIDNLTQILTKARPAYQKFLNTKAPRAFALGDTGKTGMGMGNNAVEVALKNCALATQGKPCKIIAVDNTFLLTKPCTTNSESWKNVTNEAKTVKSQDCASASSLKTRQ